MSDHRLIPDANQAFEYLSYPIILSLLCLLLAGCVSEAVPTIPVETLSILASETPFVSATSPKPLPTAATPPQTTPTFTAAPATTAVDELGIPGEATQWLKANAIGFDIWLPGNGCEDLRPLMDMVGEARIVAIGEATHGTKEFITMKHRILECLVQEKGFNIFALEAGWAEANHINEYIHDPQSIDNIQVRYPFFSAGSELWDLIDWMRRYNLDVDPAARITLRGFDMQFGDLIIQDLLGYITKVDPNSLESVKDELACFRTHVQNFSINPEADRYSLAGADIQALCRQGLQNVHDLFLSNQAEYKNSSSEEEFDETLYLVNLLIQNEQVMAATDLQSSINLRDRFMANNIAWLLEQAGTQAKMVISAHNGHVTPARSLWTAQEARMMGGQAGTEFIPMGNHLREMYGQDLIVIGSAFGRGSFWAFGFSQTANQSIGYQVFDLPGPLPNSHETYFTTAGLPRFILDLRLMRHNPELKTWFYQPRRMTSFGMGYITDNPEANTVSIVFPEEFDLLVYFENTSASDP